MKKRKRNNTVRKFLNTVFVGTYISFLCFLYLFATRVTPWDIDYFIKDTSASASKLVLTLKAEKAEFDAKREANALAKALEKKSKKKPAEEMQTEPAEEKTEGGETILKSDTFDLVYYSQTDPRWEAAIYGGDNVIGVFGCGPTTLAMVASTLTDNEVTPPAVAKWALENGHFANNSGSYHSIIPKGAQHYGLSSKSLGSPTKKTILNELSGGNLVVVLMDQGLFTSQGHFIILRGVTAEGQVLLADSQSTDNSRQSWNVETILEEAKYSASSGGPFWSIGKTS